MHPEFSHQAKELQNTYLLKTEALFVNEKNSWFAAFAEHLQTVCAKIRKLQDGGTLPAISHLEYTMLYTNLINRNYIAEVIVYGSESYLDKKQCVVSEYGISHLFCYFDELWDKLLAVRKRFMGSVSALEVKAFMLESAPYFYSYLTNTARFAIAGCVEKPFAGIVKNDVFKVSAGEYMAGTETVFVLSKNKDAAALADWFLEQLENSYTFGDYSCLDFSGRLFPDTDFRYAQFCGSSLENTSLVRSSLIGAEFKNARMEDCRLDYCTINEADFSKANLKNASFFCANARSGLPDKNIWKFVGFLPASFRGADLTGADFRGADLTGADFTGAVLQDTSFDGAILDNAFFSGNLTVNKLRGITDGAVFHNGRN